MNSMSVEYDTEVTEVKFSVEEKVLISRPSWGEYFANLKIPSASIDLPVYQGDEDEQLAKGVGHYFGSFFPGEGASIILAAHNGVGLFHTLPEAKVGDIVTMDTTYGKFNYKIYQTEVIYYKDENKLPIQKDQEILMIYTCYPVDKMFFSEYRYVVYAKLVGEVHE